MRILRTLLGVLVLLSGSTAWAQGNGLGLNMHIPDEGLLDAAQDLGVNWLRMDANWFQLNPSNGTYNWAVLDGPVQSAVMRGFNVYLTLAYTPTWVPKVARVRNDTVTNNDEPLTSAEWVTFVEAAVTHYSAMGVTHFGIWNEANLDGFWEEEAGADAWVDKIQVPGAAAVKRACSTCKVLGPDLAHVGDYHLFMERVLERAVTTFDVITHHSYNGWPETGTEIWDGDRFLNAIEARRFSFTRPALRELLDEAGWTGEVWITETGYRARPVGDAAAENTQATYVRRVMEEQLLRPWWTHTFFYEVMDCGVDQAECDIDGFGILRGTRPLTQGARSFPAHYRIKPAFNVIRQFVDEHPEIVSGMPVMPPPPAQRRTLEARVGMATVDGQLDEWSPSEFTALGDADWRGVVPLAGTQDLRVRVAARHAGNTLYVAVEAVDDVHVNMEADDLLWRADSLQLGFDINRNGGTAYDTTDDHELNVALVNGDTRTFRFHGPASANAAWTATVRRTGTTTVYEMALGTAQLVPSALATGNTLGFSFLVNDNDGTTTADPTGREGWVQFTDGIGNGKRPSAFGDLVLTSVAAPPPGTDAGMPPMVTDAGSQVMDAGVRADAATTAMDAAVNVVSDAGNVSTADGGGGSAADAGDAADSGTCACAEAGRSAPWGAFMALLGSLMRIRRRH